VLTIQFTEFTQIEEPPSTPYMDVPPSTPCMDVMKWFAMGKLSQKGRLSHTCMQQVFIFQQAGLLTHIFNKQDFPSFLPFALTYTIILGWSGTPWQRRY